MNYAINLAGTNPEDLQRALALVPSGGAAPASYPEIGVPSSRRAPRPRSRQTYIALRAAGIPSTDRPDPRGPVPYYERSSCPTDKKDEAPASQPCGGRPELHAR